MFVDIVAKDFNVLKAAADNNDWHEVGQIAHKLKSTLGNMGVTSLLPFIAELEAGTGDRLANVKGLDEGIARVLEQIKTDYQAIF
jgi:HPt (histidine-containing phosphotransfer) domain-containing protein